MRRKMMIDQKQLRRLVNGSIEYFVKDGILTIRDYYAVNDRRIDIDLHKLTPEILEQLAPDEEDEDERME